MGLCAQLDQDVLQSLARSVHHEKLQHEVEGVHLEVRDLNARGRVESPCHRKAAPAGRPPRKQGRQVRSSAAPAEARRKLRNEKETTRCERYSERKDAPARVAKNPGVPALWNAAFHSDRFKMLRLLRVLHHAASQSLSKVAYDAFVGS